MSPSTGAILLAAGRGERAGGEKQFALLGGIPLFLHSARVMADWQFAALALVVPAGRELEVAEMLGARLAARYKLVAGGERRQDSVKAGLEALGDVDWVVVHDAARPFVDGEMVERVLKGACPSGAATVGTPLGDTLKRADGEGYIVETVDRKNLWSVQTPQAFRRDLLLGAHDESTGDATDDAALVERLGLRVALVEGPASNIKVTTREDLELAEAILGMRRADDA
ncbi:MAG: 2-C-methyl-D-erythritol 4-phosphate cytidylyltransferase [Dehalococcoidia bacterium]